MGQSEKIIKDHKKIIATISTKSRKQLERMVSYFESKGKSFSHDVTRKLGSIYGDFVDALTHPVCVSLCKTIGGAFSNYGSNEMLLADLFCLCTNAELKESKIYYDKNHACTGSSLQGLIDSKSIGTLPFWEFMGLILSVERRRDSPDDSADSIKYASELHRAGLGTTDSNKRNDELILSILAIMSRKQCQHVSQSYQEKYNCSLAEALTSTYGGSCLRALLLWTSPRSRAIAMSLERILSASSVDTGFLCFSLARVDKPLLASALGILTNTFQRDASKALKKALKGNCLQAVQGWCFLPSVDGGTEWQLTERWELLNQRKRDDEISSEDLEDISTILREQRLHLDQHVAKAGLGSGIPDFNTFEAPSAHSERKGPKKHEVQYAAHTSVHVDKKDNSSPISASPSRSPRPTYATAVDSHEDVEIDYSTHVSHGALLECLELWMALLDKEETQSVSLTHFIEMVVSWSVGYSAQSVEQLVRGAGWLYEDVIIYPEILGDFASHMIGTMVKAGMDVDSRVNQLWEVYAEAAEHAWEECVQEDGGFGGGDLWDGESSISGGISRMCEELESYLKDTFDWFDARQCGYLNPDEFWEAMKGIFCKQDNQRLEVNRLRVSKNNHI